MKRIFCFLLITGSILCTGCSSAEPQPHVKPPIQNAGTSADGAAGAEDLFLGTLKRAPNGGYSYPDTYGGMYVDKDKLVFQATSEDFSEYQYLQDAYPNVTFQHVEYSYNSLQKMIDDYLETYDSNTEQIYMAYVDVMTNRAVIEVDETTFSQKTPDDKSPLVFVIGSAIKPM